MALFCGADNGVEARRATPFTGLSSGMARESNSPSVDGVDVPTTPPNQQNSRRSNWQIADRRVRRRDVHPMSLILLIVVLILLFGGGGYYGHRRGYYGGGGLSGILGLLVIVLIVLFLFGGLSGGYYR